MIEGRLHSKLAPYWVWAVLKMVLIPSQVDFGDLFRVHVY